MLRPGACNLLRTTDYKLICNLQSAICNEESMGKKSRAKRERREQAGFVASLTTSEGTFLERPPPVEEQLRINAAFQELKKHRVEADAFAADPEAANRSAIELFRSPLFAPLQFEDWV